jgi:Flp pilus assembly protein TadD
MGSVFRHGNDRNAGVPELAREAGCFLESSDIVNGRTGEKARPGARQFGERREFAATPRGWLISGWGSIALIVAATAAAYANSLRCPFIFDDLTNIVANASIRHLWPLRDVFLVHAAGKAVMHSRPVVNLTFAINYAMGGLNTLPFHLTNLVIHLLAGLTLFGVVRRTLVLPGIPERFSRRAVPLALAVALLWALHPLQTQAVTFVTQRYESLMGLFYLAALYGLVRSGTSSQGRAWAAASVAAATLALGCKEVAVSAPLILLLYDRAFLAGSVREAWARRRGMYVGLLGAWLGFAVLQVFSGSRGEWAGYSLPVPWHQYASSQFGVILHYLRLSLWPQPLVLDYGWPVAGSASEILPGAIVVGGAAAASGYALVRRPKLGFLGGWFFLILAPTSSVMPITDLAFLHRMYLPLAALVVLAALGAVVAIDALVRRGRLGARGAAATATGLVAVVAASLAAGTWQRNRDFGSPVSIWRDTVAKAPRNPRAHYNLGYAYSAQGRSDEAIAEYRTAVALEPNYAWARNNLGAALAGRGQVEEAIAHFRKVLELSPGYAEAHNNLGLALAGRGQAAEAIAHFRKALELSPDYAEAHLNLGSALARSGQLEEAFAHYRKAQELNPGSVEARITTPGERRSTAEGLTLKRR